MAEFEFEDVTIDPKFPTFRVWHQGGWSYDLLGVVRNVKNSPAKKRLKLDTGLDWTAALSHEADPAKWADKHTRSGYTQREVAMWLLGARDAVTNPRNVAAKAMLAEDMRRSLADNVCPSCGGKVSSEFIHGNETKCESCDAELYRNPSEKTPFERPLWKARNA